MQIVPFSDVANRFARSRLSQGLQLWTLLLVIGLWVVLQAFVLPRLGVPT